MQRDVVPDFLGSVTRYALFHQELACRASPLDFEAMRSRRVGGEAEVVEHRGQKHQLAVDLRIVLLRKKLAEPIATHDMVEEHVIGYRTREFLGLSGNTAIGSLDVRDHAGFPKVLETTELRRRRRKAIAALGNAREHG